MYQNRPIYAVVGKSSDKVTYRNQVFEYTSILQSGAKFTINQVAADASARELDLFQFNTTVQ
jgi:hypothetical protein